MRLSNHLPLDAANTTAEVRRHAPQAQPNAGIATQRSHAEPRILQLQRRYGNRYVQRMVAQMRQGGAAEAPPGVEDAITRRRGGGQALDGALRAQMEPAFGADFSSVRVHTDPTADRLSRALSARAFTTGHDIFFRHGEYNPTTASGQELLAHELTHVVQQSGATVQGKLTVGAPDDEYEREADQVAAQVMRRLAAPDGSGVGQDIAAEDASLPPVQRHVASPQVQGAWSQIGTTDFTDRGTSGLSGDHTEFEVFLPNGVWGQVWAHQNTEWYNKALIGNRGTGLDGATTSLFMWKATQYTFRHDGKDDNLLELTVSGNLQGSAKAEDLHFAKSGAMVAGFTRVRTPSDKAPTPTQLFVISDGGKSSAKVETVADIEISIPFRGTTTTVKIPLKATKEGEASPFIKALTPPFSQNVSGTVGAETIVDVYLAARIEADADVESESYGDLDTNWAEARATYTLLKVRDTPAPQTLPSSGSGSSTGDAGGTVSPLARKWGCEDVRCNVYPVREGAKCPDRVVGNAAYIYDSYDEACKAAQRDANSKVPEGCNKRHCNCNTKCSQK